MTAPNKPTVGQVSNFALGALGEVGGPSNSVSPRNDPKPFGKFNLEPFVPENQMVIDEVSVPRGHNPNNSSVIGANVETGNTAE